MSNFESNQSHKDNEVRETVTTKRIIKKSTRINNANPNEPIRQSQIKQSVWKNDSFDEGNFEELRKNKILDRLTNAHVLKLKNRVLLKEINNAHDEVERLMMEGDMASAKMMETELNDLHSTVIFSNTNPFTKSRLGKTAYYSKPYGSSFNQSQFSQNYKNLNKTYKTKEQQLFEYNTTKSTRVNNRNYRKEEEEIQEEEDEESSNIKNINKSKKGNKNQKDGKNKTNLNNLKDGNKMGENDNDNNDGNQKDFNINNSSNNANNRNDQNNQFNQDNQVNQDYQNNQETQNNPNNQNFINNQNNPNSQKSQNPQNSQNFSGDQNFQNSQNFPNNNLRNSQNLDRNGNINIPGNNRNVQYIPGGDNQIIIIKKIENSNMNQDDNVDNVNINKRKKKKRKKKNKNLNPQDDHYSDNSKSIDIDKDIDDDDEKEESSEKRGQVYNLAKKSMITQQYEDNMIYQADKEEQNPKSPDNISDIPTEKSFPVDENQKQSPNYSFSNGPNQQQKMRSFPDQPENPNILDKFPNDNQNPQIFQNQFSPFPYSNNPNQPSPNTLNPNTDPVQYYAPRQNNQNLNPNIYQNFPQNPSSNNPFPDNIYPPYNPYNQAFPQSFPNKAKKGLRPKSANGKRKQIPDSIYYMGPRHNPGYPQRPNLYFGKPLSMIYKNKSKEKEIRYMPATILYKKGYYGSCFACDIDCGISRNGNSPNNYNPYEGSRRYPRYDNTFYNSNYYYQYHKHHGNY